MIKTTSDAFRSNAMVVPGLIVCTEHSTRRRSLVWERDPQLVRSRFDLLRRSIHLDRDCFGGRPGAYEPAQDLVVRGREGARRYHRSPSPRRPSLDLSQPEHLWP